MILVYLRRPMKMLRRFILFGAFISVFLLTSCSEYTKVLKSDDYYLKLAKAKEYYEKGKYYQALPLFDELLTYFKGTTTMQDVLYYYAYCHYRSNEFLVAAYHFKNFADTYTSDPRAEECLFMSAKCYYEVSPSYMLDQGYTNDCIQAIQLFVNTYPDSKYVFSANQLMDEMRAKLEKKAFYSADLYYRMKKYKAASVEFENLLRAYSDSPNAEQVSFLIIKSDYLYALNSVPSKQEERYEKTIAAYKIFSLHFKGSAYLPEATDIYNSALKNLHKIEADD